MSNKRGPEDAKSKSESGASSDDKRRKPPAFSSVVLEVMKLQSVRNLLEPILEPLVRRVVREEVELALRKHLTSTKQTSGREIDNAETRSLQLKFENSISLPVFTGSRIEGDDGSNLKVGLVDALTGKVVSSGSESLAKVEIVVLEGDFEVESDHWMPEEFNSNIVKEREGKKGLLTGDVILYLKDGSGMVGEITFTDNSSWTRSRRFRLGARVVDNFDSIIIRGAKTESFIVRDHRGELYKKHHPPSLSDEVWRLEKIGKDGAFHKRLSREKIRTVKDFLTLLNMDPAKLRNILGTGMSTKMWEVTMEHARNCVLDSTRHLYVSPQSQQKTGVVFNAVGQLTGLLSESEYIPVDNLSETEKAEAQSSVISALKQGENVTSFEDEASLMDGPSKLTDVLHSRRSPRTEGSSANKLEGSSSNKLLVPEKTGVGFNYEQASASSPAITSSIYSVGGISGLDDYCLPNFDSMGLGYDQGPSFPIYLTNSLVCETDSMAPAFIDEYNMQFFNTDIHSQSHIQEDLLSSSDGFMLAHTSNAIGKARKRWRKVFNVLKWFMVWKGVKYM
ncbi:unnamed protein product [Lupinus luteus]|uniref:Calmodulin-binding protein n=1 Tax=Lupinus luteus TaxID=3873 RepID=A0AAV1YA17_LUPLU